MSLLATAFTKVNRGMNRVMRPWLESPRLHGLIGRRMALISYTGRRSGNTFSTPVAYSRKGSVVTIMVAMPDHKSWWRNFQGGGGEMQLNLNGVTHAGHATASRSDKGRVSVTVQLTD